MLSWLKRKPVKNVKRVIEIRTEPAAPQGHGMSKTFLALHEYQESRSDVAFLTFAQMEDLLKSPLPAAARRDLAWWNGDDEANFEHANSWRLANRTAAPNLMAQTVRFARV
jgi:hypothetical protein